MDKRRNARKLIGLMLILLLTVCALPGAAETSPYINEPTDTSESAERVDETVATITAEIEELRSQISLVETELLARQSAVSTVGQYKELLDRQIALLTAEVDCLDRLLAYYDLLIARYTAEIDEMQQVYDVEFQALAVRLRQSYEEGMPGLLEYLSRSDSLLSVLVGMERRSEIEEYDRSLMEALNTGRKEIASRQNELLELRAERYLLATERADRTQYLNTKLQEGGSFLRSLTDEPDRFSYYVQLSQAGVQTADRQIARAVADHTEALGDEGLSAEIAEKRLLIGSSLQAMMEQGDLQKGSEYYDDGALYIWPLTLDPDRKAEFSASMGYRTYQVGGKTVGDYHGGIDLAAEQGTQVVAAASGKVADAGYAEGYGYYVAILHADGSVTRYAHLGAITVTVGDCVLQGEVIGSAGCSGNSSGVGCHFELWINGERVNPEPYLTLPADGLSETAE